MPRRGDIEAATPRCQATRQEPGPESVNFGLRGGVLRAMVELLCLMPMRYQASDNSWLCECGSSEPGEYLAARASGYAFEPEAEAA
jgi:hypothetical protein